MHRVFVGWREGRKLAADLLWEGREGRLKDGGNGKGQFLMSSPFRQRA